MQDYKEKALDLERECRRDLMSSDPRQALASLLQAKRLMLETSAYALQEGEALIKLLNATIKDESGVTWPGQVKREVGLAIGQVSLFSNFFIFVKKLQLFQVELWLEELHDRRVVCTRLFEQRFKELKKLLDNYEMQDQDNDHLIRELNELSELLSSEEREESACHQELGSSVSSCDRCIRDAVAKQAKLQQINDR